MKKLETLYDVLSGMINERVKNVLVRAFPPALRFTQDSSQSRKLFNLISDYSKTWAIFVICIYL